MDYQGKYTGEQIDELLGKAENAPFESGDGENGAKQVGSPITVFGQNCVGEGLSSDNAQERGITDESTKDEIINEWSREDTPKFSLVMGRGSHIEGQDCLALGNTSHAEGNGSIAKNSRAHAEGTETFAEGGSSHAEGWKTQALGNQAHAEGHNSIAKGAKSHTEGYGTVTGEVAEIDRPAPLEDEAPGICAHAEGNATYAPGMFAHAEGRESKAVAYAAHAEGLRTQATGGQSHAEGDNTLASGFASHAEGFGCHATAPYSHASGEYTRANSRAQFVCGMWNAQEGDSENPLLFALGRGTDEGNRRNAVIVDRRGQVFIDGIGNYHGTNYLADGVISVQEVIDKLENDKTELIRVDGVDENGFIVNSVQQFGRIRRTFESGRRVVLYYGAEYGVVLSTSVPTAGGAVYVYTSFRDGIKTLRTIW